MKTPRSLKSLIGKKAFLKDVCCQSHQTGACTIVAVLKHPTNPTTVLVVWDGDIYNEAGSFGAVPLSHLEEAR